MPESVDQIRIAILGASGYTGAELVRMLARHPAAEIRVLTAERQAGKPLAEVFPHLAYLNLPNLVKIEQVDWSEIDFVFCGLPHGTTQEIIRALPHTVKIVDLSADFRLTDPDSYAEWYGHEHAAVELQREAVYGLTEFNRQGVRNARLVANPGCYPTATLIPLLPLVLDGLIQTDDIIVDAKSGVSGAGRDAKQANLFCEVSEGMHAYGVGHHRHMPEMEQELSIAAGKPVTMAFTPHLIPMNRGEFITTYVKLAGKNGPDDLRAALAARFADEPFVQVLPAGVVPHTKHVRGSNQVHISVFKDRLPGRAIVLSVLDNLVKGASGQAIQNFNVVNGLIETMGLEQAPMFP